MLIRKNIIGIVAVGAFCLASNVYAMDTKAPVAVKLTDLSTLIAKLDEKATPATSKGGKKGKAVEAPAINPQTEFEGYLGKIQEILVKAATLSETMKLRFAGMLPLLTLKIQTKMSGYIKDIQDD